MLKAKQVVKGKFWVVEKPDGTKVATLQTNPNGITFVDNERRERFHSLRHLKAKYNIAFETQPSNEPQVTPSANTVYGYPADVFPEDPLWNVALKVPTYRKDAKSQSLYCAGHYLIEFNKGVWARMFCPKLISIQRYRFHGPFVTDKEAEDFQKMVAKQKSSTVHDK